MPSLHTKHTHKYTMNMNTGLNQLASLYNKDEEAKNNKQKTTTNKQCASQSKTAIQQCMEREEGMSVLLIILLIRSHIVLH